MKNQMQKEIGRELTKFPSQIKDLEIGRELTELLSWTPPLKSKKWEKRQIRWPYKNQVHTKIEEKPRKVKEKREMGNVKQKLPEIGRDWWTRTLAYIILVLKCNSTYSFTQIAKIIKLGSKGLKLGVHSRWGKNR